ncbi:hypothetical protein B7R77_00740 [Ralstonia solanacearum K60]|uniref:Tyrosinase copper-binding domain-containing protein n=2 Tax=Ralstonia TaxID=48736 RepID=A0AAP7ZKC4_RALSL|nr:hypothetical protein B7R77_00740 [Ralstonia solanacearum K60]
MRTRGSGKAVIGGARGWLNPVQAVIGWSTEAKSGRGTAGDHRPAVPAALPTLNGTPQPEEEEFMPYVRRDVYSLPAGDKTLEWYGKAIEKLQSRPITDVTSWLSLGAIHGIAPGIWKAFQLIQPGETMPDQHVQDTLWNQCQHMTWYFLPWHRGYLAAHRLQLLRPPT